MTYGPPTAQEHLRQSVRYSTDPRWRAQHSPPPAEPPHRSIPWGIVIVAIVGLGFSLFLFGYAYASEPPRTWIVWNVDADKPWTSAKGHKATATGPTACMMSLHEVSKSSPDGSRLACRKLR